jgi:hypothetical protein
LYDLALAPPALNNHDMRRGPRVVLSIFSTLLFLLVAPACNSDRALATGPSANGTFTSPGVASVGASGAAAGGAAGSASATAPPSTDADVPSRPPMPAPEPPPSATCGTPPGPAVPLSTTGQLYAAMTGRWQICSGRDIWKTVGAPTDAVGVEYSADGRMYYLVAGAGGAVRGSGFDYQLTYDVLVSGQVNMHPAPNAAFFGTLQYSSTPRELQLAPFWYNSSGSTLVPFADVPDAGAIAPPVTCVATCLTPAGEVKAFSTVDEVYAAMAGRWFICQGVDKWKSIGAPPDVAGIEFGRASSAPGKGSTVGGNMYFLVMGPDGLTRAAVSSYQPTYALWPFAGFQLDLSTAPNLGRTTTVRYSPCPRELELPGMGEPNTIFIPAP